MPLHESHPDVEDVAGEKMATGGAIPSEEVSWCQMNMNVYGKVGIGVKNIAENISLDVNGPIRFQGKRFHIGTEAPSEGAHSQGDITWNSNPTPGNVIGWVCTKTGNPGLWKSFGTIGN